MKKILLLISTILLLAAACSQRTNIQQDNQLTNPIPQQSTPSSTPDSASKNNWKTYKNDNYGFEIQYPNSYLADFNSSTNVLEIAEPHGDIDNSEFAGFWVYIFENDKNLSAEGWWKQSKDFSPDDKIDDITIAGIRGVKVVSQASLSQTDVILNHQGRIYDLIRLGLNDSTYNQLISTFKFIK